MSTLSQPSATPGTAEHWATFVQSTAPVIVEYPEFQAIQYDFYWATLARQERSGPRVAAMRDLAKRVLRRRRSEVPAGHADVLIWLGLRRDMLFQAVEPVALQLRERGVRVVIVALSAYAEALQSARIPFGVVEVPYIPGTRRRRRRAFQALQSHWDQVPEQSWPTFDALSILSHSLEDEAARILRQVSPSVVVLPHDNQNPASTVCRVAASLGIETLTFQHGGTGALDVPLFGSRHAVWGNHFRKVLLDVGVAPQQLAVLGSTRHDGFGAVDRARASHELHAALAIPPVPVFTFFSGGHAASSLGAEPMQQSAGWLAEVARRFRGQLAVVVRLHPNEDASLYEGAPQLHLMTNECDVETTIRGSDGLGSFSSTALYEAVLCATPAAQFLADGWPELLPNWRYGLAVRVDSATALVGFLEAVVERHPGDGLGVAPQTVEELFAYRGHASEWVADYVMSLGG